MTRQVEDDLKTLDEMLADMREAPDVYRPTNFWSVYHDDSCRMIREQGVGEFRSHRAPAWASFGAVADPLLGYAKPLLGEGVGLRPAAFRSAVKVLRKLPLLGEVVVTFEKLTDAYESHLKMLLELSYHYCLNADPKKRLTRIGDSGAGAPDIQMRIGGETYTLHFLRYFLQYLHLCRFVDFDKVRRIVEIGGGYGGMAEVVLKLHPHVIYIDVDIPPQIYVAERYLTACFEGGVHGYRESRKLNEVSPGHYDGARVVTLCPWQLPRLRGDFDLFINSASFQEMEPPIVENYARYLNELVSGHGYIRAMPHGAFVAPKRGMRGVLEKTTLDHYREFFRCFELIDDSPAEVLPNLPGTLDAYRDFVFRRRVG